MMCGCHLPAFVNHTKKVYNRSVTVRGKCQEAPGAKIRILNYAQCKDYSLFQRNLQCQTSSKITCNDSSVTSCPGAEPVCRFAMSMNGVTMKIEKSCSTYRKCVEAMRNNTLTCNKWTFGTSCVGCCVGHLCNKHDFLDWTNFFHLTSKKFSECKISAENVSKAMERELTTTGTITIEYSGLDRNRTIFSIYSKPYSKTSKKQLLRNISQVLSTSQTLRSFGVRHTELFDEIFCDESTTSNNNQTFSWPMTKIGTTAEIPCLGNVATRYCSPRDSEMASSQYMTTAKYSPFTGIWKEPDMSQCNNTEGITRRLKVFAKSIDTDKSLTKSRPTRSRCEDHGIYFITKEFIKTSERRRKVIRETDNFFSMRDDKLYRVTQNAGTKQNVRINSHVLASNIPNLSVGDLDEPVNISFNILDQNASNLQCVYWDESSGVIPGWSSRGCQISKHVSGKEIVCSCDHLTSFAVLMNVYQAERETDNVLSIISKTGCGISFVCLVLTIIIHVCFRKLWDLMSSKVLVSLCSSLAVTYFIFLVGMQSYVQTMAGCKAVAVLLHYFLLTSLAWMSVEAFHVFLSVVVVFKRYQTSFMKKSSILAWGIPAVIVIITLAINSTNNYIKIAEVCWLNIPSFFAAFLTPVVMVLIFNFIMFSRVITRLISTQRNKRFEHKRRKVRVLGLDLVMKSRIEEQKQTSK
ncbi:adhesion G-protein coupled receptor G6-like isoform X1 [Octopus vulgaris]|uniref:Adhesion G-protein coupled receptor G6-like isoform X1 n=1 Tax=Octopus vulgaris TaxID=6645 RepID=A0AA36HHX1_OCTVU|nr:adhesion G-protein coupled receptor G6-like isoform X1 [Octopus vulgaris]